LLQMNENIEVVEPVELREIMISRLESALKNYNS
jgi:predicted DNA-binding transcriptional regulator YafY